MTKELQPQEWALVAEALVTWAGDPNDIYHPRGERAYELVEEIAAQLGCRPSDLVAGRYHSRCPRERPEYFHSPGFTWGEGLPCRAARPD